MRLVYFMHNKNLALLASLMMSLSLMSCQSESTPDVLPKIPEPSVSPSPTGPYPNVKGQDFHGEKNFAFLLNNYQKGKTEPTPWAGYWWPYTANGIAAGNFYGNQSPAGKYDAARGHKTDAQTWEIRNHGAGVPKVQSWWGHCNGWCAAAALFPEPKQAVTVNGINFGIGDIKGLLSEAGMAANADFFGERIDVDDASSPKYLDTVPDQYFLVLTNYIGKLKQAVLVDRYTGSEVWNQPLAGYKLEYPTTLDYLGNTPEAPDVYRIMVSSTIWWLDDGVPADVQTHTFDYEDEDPTGIVQSRTLRMEVWVDAPIVFDSAGKITSSGDVIVTRKGEYVAGGAWRMGEGYYVDAWPDYMWVPYSIGKPSDPEQDYANPEIDIEWIKAHLLVGEGVDDPSVSPGNIDPAPVPHYSGIPGLYPNPFPNLFPGTGIPGMIGLPGGGMPNWGGYPTLAMPGMPMSSRPYTPHHALPHRP